MDIWHKGEESEWGTSDPKGALGLHGRGDTRDTGSGGQLVLGPQVRGDIIWGETTGTMTPHFLIMLPGRL